MPSQDASCIDLASLFKCWKGVAKKKYKIASKGSDNGESQKKIGGGKPFLLYSSSFSSVRKIPAVETPLEESDVQPRLLMHHGIPALASVAACNPVQRMLAIATRDGRIKVFGDSRFEILLQPSKGVPITFLQFFNNQGLLASSDMENNVELWELDSASLIGSHRWGSKVTALSATQDSKFLYIGDASGTVGVLQYHRVKLEALSLSYKISINDSLGAQGMNVGNTYVVGISSQPGTEHERALISFKNGISVLWAFAERAVIAVLGGTSYQHQQLRKTTDSMDNLLFDRTTQKEEDLTKELEHVCWACPKGSTFAAGYSDGDVWLWSIMQAVKLKASKDGGDSGSMKYSHTPLCKIKVGSTAPIVALRWWASSDSKHEKDGYICAFGGKNAGAYDVLKVISLKEAYASKSECYVDLCPPKGLTDCFLLEMLAKSSQKSQTVLVGLSIEGRLFAYEMNAIYDSFSDRAEDGSLFLPAPMVFPLLEHRITTSKIILLGRCGSAANHLIQAPRVLDCGYFYRSASNNEKHHLYGYKEMTALVDSDSKGCYLYVTGHENGLVKLWDLSTMYLYSICNIENQNKGRLQGSQNELPSSVSALDYCPMSGLLAIGFASGLITLHRQNIKTENLKSDKSSDGKLSWILLAEFPMQSASILCVVIASHYNRVAAGSETGMVTLIDLNTNKLVCNDRRLPGLTSGVVSLCFAAVYTAKSEIPCCGPPSILRTQHAANTADHMTIVLLVATKNADLLLVDAISGICCVASPLRPKNSSKAISLQLLDGSDFSLINNGGFQSNVWHQESKKIATEIGVTNSNRSMHTTQPCQNMVLLSSEESLRIYEMSALLKGVCSPLLKVKLEKPCCWCSTFQTPTKRVGLALLYGTGIFEFRSFPDLKVINSSSLRGILNWRVEPSDGMLRTISCTINGQTALIDRDQELIFISMLDKKHEMRFPRFCPVQSDAIIMAETAPVFTGKKIKKKKLFGRIKAKNVTLKVSDSGGSSAASPKMSDLDQNITPRSYISSPSHQSNDGTLSDSSSIVDNSNMSLKIDDLDIDDDSPTPTDSSRTSNHRSLMRKVKRNLAGKDKFEGPEKGKGKTNTDTAPQSDLSPVGRPRTLDQIKATYGQGKEQHATKTAAAMRDKLLQQRERLRAIDDKTSEMQDGAQNFHKLAQELVRTLEEKNRKRFF